MFACDCAQPGVLQLFQPPIRGQLGPDLCQHLLAWLFGHNAGGSCYIEKRAIGIEYTGLDRHDALLLQRDYTDTCTSTPGFTQANRRVGLQAIFQKRKPYTMSEAKSGDTVRIHYTGTLADGSTFDSSEGRDPLEFKLGSGQVIPGFDKAVTGMSVGDEQTVEIPCTDAYGSEDPNAKQSFPRDKIPADIPLEIGTQLQLSGPQGQPIMVRVAEVTEEAVILDANHPLAGKDLTFKIELVEIV
mgnify:CR=1 FL=1